METRHAFHTLGQAGSSESLPGLVFDMHVMVGLSPVVTHEHLRHWHLLIDGRELEATSSPLMVQCSKHVIPPAIEADLTDQAAHDLGLGLTVLPLIVLTDRRLRTILTLSGKMVDPH